MARAAFPIADRVSLADVGEHMKRKSDGHEGLALGEVQAALVDGCGVELVWIKEGREVCREYPDKPDFWRRPILVWHGVLPRRLHVQLSPEEQKGDQLVTFLCLTDAVRRGLWPASELPQAKQQSEQQPQQPPEKRELASVDGQPRPRPQPQPQPPVSKLSGKEWVRVAYERRSKELRAMTITDAAHALAKESKTASDCAKSLGKGHCTNLLRELNVWSKKPRNSPKQGPK